MELTGSRTVELLAKLNLTTLLCLIVGEVKLQISGKKTLKLI